MSLVSICTGKDIRYLHERYKQGVPKGTDTFQSFIIKKLDNLRVFIYHFSQYQVQFFQQFWKIIIIIVLFYLFIQYYAVLKQKSIR